MCILFSLMFCMNNYTLWNLIITKKHLFKDDTSWKIKEWMICIKIIHYEGPRCLWCEPGTQPFCTLLMCILFLSSTLDADLIELACCNLQVIDPWLLYWPRYALKHYTDTTNLSDINTQSICCLIRWLFKFRSTKEQNHPNFYYSLCAEKLWGS